MMNSCDIKPPCYGGTSPELLYSGRSSPEATYPYPLYKDPAMERLKLAHMKQNQVSKNSMYRNIISNMDKPAWVPPSPSFSLQIWSWQVACLQVGTVVLHGARIVSLIIDAKERLCLAQISNTLLKEFSYNEIHNRRVALGITCVQCTPVQLEILRRAGAMPISSRWIFLALQRLWS